MGSVPTYAERIMRIISTASRPLDDDEIAQRMGVVRQNVNQVCRRLEAQGVIRRVEGPGGKIVNELLDGSVASSVPPPRQPVTSGSTLMTEDDVKRAVSAHFLALGLQVDVRWGRDRGVDVLAYGNGQRWVVEAKGEVASDQQQGSYFLGALGELVQRMDDPSARYALALPDNRRYRGLVSRLPRLAREQLRLTVLFVRPDGAVVEDAG